MNIMGCDHPSFVPIGPLVGELWHFQHFPIWLPSANLNFKILIFDHVTVIDVVNCCCVPNFIKIGSRVRPLDAHNCYMFNASLLGNAIATASWRTCRRHDGMRPPKFRSNRSIDRRVIAFPTFPTILNWNFVILHHPRSQPCGSWLVR